MIKPSAAARVRGPEVGRPPSDDDGLRVFKALSHETRVRILRLLDGRECTVSELTAEFDLAQPSISRHLSILKEADLVRRRRQGQCVYYRLDADELGASLRGFLQRFRQCGASAPATADGRARMRRHPRGLGAERYAG